MAELIDGEIVEIDWPEPIVKPKPKTVKSPANYSPISTAGGEPVSVSEAISELTSNSDFPEIYHRTRSIDDVAVSWSFLMRRCYEIGSETGQNIGAIAQNNAVSFQKALEEYGLHFLCPYFEHTQKPPTNEVCHIRQEPIDSVCAGKYFICDLFTQKTGQAALGTYELSEKLTLPTMHQVPDRNLPPVDLIDLRDWWENEGIYS